MFFYYRSHIACRRCRHKPPKEKKGGLKGGRGCRAPWRRLEAGRTAPLWPTKPGFGCIQDASKTSREVPLNVPRRPRAFKAAPRLPRAPYD